MGKYLLLESDVSSAQYALRNIYIQIIQNLLDAVYFLQICFIGSHGAPHSSEKLHGMEVRVHILY